MNDEILTISQTAAYLKIIEKKELSTSKVGGSWRIKTIDIKKYLGENKNR